MNLFRFGNFYVAETGSLMKMSSESIPDLKVREGSDTGKGVSNQHAMFLVLDRRKGIVFIEGMRFEPFIKINLRLRMLPHISCDVIEVFSKFESINWTGAKPIIKIFIA